LTAHRIDLTVAPVKSTIFKSLGIAVISLDLSSTLTCPNTKRLRLAQALTMWVGNKGVLGTQTSSTLQENPLNSQMRLPC